MLENNDDVSEQPFKRGTSERTEDDRRLYPAHRRRLYPSKTLLKRRKGRQP